MEEPRRGRQQETGNAEEAPIERGNEEEATRKRQEEEATTESLRGRANEREATTRDK